MKERSPMEYMVIVLVAVAAGVIIAFGKPRNHNK